MEKPSIYSEPDTSHIEAATARIRDDLESGVIDRVTFSMARKQYGISSDIDIRNIQHTLRRSGHLTKKGNRFISAKAA